MLYRSVYQLVVEVGANVGPKRRVPLALAAVGSAARCVSMTAVDKVGLNAAEPPCTTRTSSPSTPKWSRCF